MQEERCDWCLVELQKNDCEYLAAVIVCKINNLKAKMVLRWSSIEKTSLIALI
jgi:hypothetical protein